MNDMKPVYSVAWGDCFACAVASILELPLSEMPTVPNGFEDFCASLRSQGIKTESEFFPLFEKWLHDTAEEFGRNFVKVWTEWFEQRGIICESYEPTVSIKGYAIAGCADGPFTHALVLLDGEIVHDPERPENRRGQPWKITSITRVISKPAYTHHQTPRALVPPRQARGVSTLR